MKVKFNHRLLAVIIALLMVVQLVPAALLVSATDGNTHVLDATADLTAMAAGGKADGDTEVIGDYFTITYSAKTKIDDSNKTFDDGYTATQRLNFGGRTNTNGDGVFHNGFHVVLLTDSFCFDRFSFGSDTDHIFGHLGHLMVVALLDQRDQVAHTLFIDGLPFGGQRHQAL